MNDNGQLAVSTTTPGEADVSGRIVSAYDSTTYPYRDQEAINVSGTVALIGNEIAFQPNPN